MKKVIDNNGLAFYDTLVESRIKAVDTKTLNKVDKIDGKGLSTNDFTSAEKLKVAQAITGTEVDSKITAALNSITGVEFKIVTELPSTGSKGVIYLLSNGGSGNNAHDEYIWVNDKFEKIGTTAVDLSGYLKKTDIVSITNEEIEEIINAI